MPVMQYFTHPDRNKYVANYYSESICLVKIDVDQLLEGGKGVGSGKEIEFYSKPTFRDTNGIMRPLTQEEISRVPFERLSHFEMYFNNSAELIFTGPPFAFLARLMPEMMVPAAPANWPRVLAGGSVCEPLDWLSTTDPGVADAAPAPAVRLLRMAP